MKAKELAPILLANPEFDLYLPDWLDHAVKAIELEAEGVTVDEIGQKIYLGDEPYDL